MNSTKEYQRFKIAYLSSKGIEDVIVDLFADIYLEPYVYKSASYVLEEPSLSLLSVIVMDATALDDWAFEFQRLHTNISIAEIPMLLLTEERLNVQAQQTFLNQGIYTCIQKKQLNQLLLACISASKSFNRICDKNDEISSLNRRLSTNYLILDSKNHCIESIRSKADDLGEKEILNSSLLKKELNAISKEASAHLNNEYQLELFKVHFEEVHPLFFESLLAVNKSLTTNNLKLAAFLKMGFNNNEIAYLSHVTLSTVKKSIQRLKTKLRLAPDKSLRNFINDAVYKV